jgi:hypothetical protein
LRSKKKLQEFDLFRELEELIASFPRPEFILGKHGLTSTLNSEAVRKHRNSAAHLSTFTSEKAKKTKLWCYKQINLLGLCLSSS